MIWVAFGAMALAVLAAVLRPLLKPSPTTAGRAEYDMAVFKDQLAEVDRDVSRGVITAAEAEAARIEIQRRLLAATRAKEQASTDDPSRRAMAAAAIAVLVPFMAIGVYVSLGAPGLPGRDMRDQAAIQQADAEHNAEVNQLIEQLAARMAADPANAEGWGLLARSYRQLERFAEAAEAYDRLRALTPGDPVVQAEYGEALIAAAGGMVTPEAHDALLAALRLDRSEPRAQFYLGMEQAQLGNAENAIAIWRALTAEAPEDAPWTAVVRQQMAALAQDTGVLPVNVTPRHALDVLGGGTPAAQPPPPSAMAQEQFSPENMEMIQGMVAGLAARLESDPDDYDGWMMLGRSYTVLQNFEGALAAYEKAKALRPQDIAPRLQAAALLTDMADLEAAGPLPGRLAAALQDVLALNPQQPDALYLLGLGKAKTGDAAAARALWMQADAALAPGAALKDEIARRLQSLP